MRTITLEEHFASPGFIAGPGQDLKRRAEAVGQGASMLLESLCDLSDRRIAEMDAAGIDVQFLSLTSPGTEQLERDQAIALASESNDYLAAAIQKNPGRFAGFAALPTADPAESVKELERRVRSGFKGAVINGHIRGRYLDDQFFWPILECAEALEVPIYLHPTPPPQAVIHASYEGLPRIVVEMLAGPGWGWHIETAIHVIRLVLGSVFERFPRLQLIIGHMGEALPFMMQRLDVMPIALTGLRRPISAYLQSHLYYTFSGFNFVPNFLQLLLQVGIDRIMFSADHPYASMKDARSFLDQLPVSTVDRERIAHGNAERLFGL
jgi:predicted TIM-barrel fold metal-dependent hydrolase